MTTQRLITLLLTAALTALALTAAPREKSNILSLKNSITDDNIIFPSSLDTDVNQLMTNWYLQNYTVLDADVENKSAGEVSEETYIKRLAAIPSVIEMPYNQVVRKHIERYVYRSRTLVEQMLGMSLYYMPIFEQALEKEGLPLELKYLPIVESAMDPNAVSPVGAAGLWQFMIGTAKGLGMEVNSLVDERRDPYRSSEMAAKYLKDLYRIYNDWSLAIAAYNCGPGNVNKALHRAGDKGDFWDIYEYLPKETRGYVPAFIAANYAMTYYKQHNISPALAAKPLITDTVSVARRIHFRQISEVLNIPVEEIRTLNPQYRKDVIPGDVHPYMLILPSQQVYSYIMSEDSIDNYCDDMFAHRPVVEPGGESPTVEQYLSGTDADGKVRTTTHKVQRGETASSIAAQYGMTVDELMSLNNMSSSTVRRGTKLTVRAPQHDGGGTDSGIIETLSDQGTATAQTAQSAGDMAMQNVEQAQIDEVKHIEQEAAAKAPYKGSYTANDSKSTSKQTASAKKDEQAARQSAAKSNTSNAHSRNAQYAAGSGKDKNGDKNNARKESTSNRSRSKDGKTANAGKAKGNKSKAESKPTEVTIQKGESLEQIARHNGVTVDELKQANGISDPNKITAGEKIKIPAKQKSKSSGKSNAGSGSSKSGNSGKKK